MHPTFHQSNGLRTTAYFDLQRGSREQPCWPHSWHHVASKPPQSQGLEFPQWEANLQ